MLVAARIDTTVFGVYFRSSVGARVPDRVVVGCGLLACCMFCVLYV